MTAAISRNNVRVQGQGPATLVFGHGFGTDQRAWRHVAPAFAERSRVVTYDQMGFGGSSPVHYADARYRSLEGYALDLVDVLDAVGAERVSYVGHSIGGVIGLLAAIARPERFERLVLLGSSPCFVNHPPDYLGGFEREEIEGILDAMERDQLAWAQSLAPVAMGEQSSPSQVNDFENGLSAIDAQVARRFGSIVFHVDCRDRLAEVRTPALVVQCARDSLVPREVGAYLHRHLAGSTLQEIDAAGHCPHLTHPQETVALIARYLDGASD